MCDKEREINASGIIGPFKIFGLLLSYDSFYLSYFKIHLVLTGDNI